MARLQAEGIPLNPLQEAIAKEYREQVHCLRDIVATGRELLEDTI